MGNLLVFGLGLTEILVIVLIILLLFGGRKIPELMRGIGKGIKGFRDEIQEGEKHTDKHTKDE
ncbi:twin-arginine translocase TatA/TatE family subunit [Bacteroides sp. ET225]|uniref:Sec-independent protein translocase protein TatA n=1 Tax=Candidatus Phocaeicola excrementipullorum TaxID=2838731 RepID=A0A948X2G9_9BACT|nr:twin-arginine translocase TatA/TatE family subunit [Bacteroides sp. ET225]MBU3855691.1 twin-arginine translocase TatA/TatE family subunit [Candidatus Phocaeicola excrementipullorum]MBW9198920.1 twin-arginine translocase TatA/TatE family subunit [Bacteroidales bacterium SW299]MCR8916710.1 twin-arginine translocase TatA/TatE family subunit [Bacteroides sp. ET225]